MNNLKMYHDGAIKKYRELVLLAACYDEVFYEYRRKVVPNGYEKARIRRSIRARYRALKKAMLWKERANHITHQITIELIIKTALSGAYGKFGNESAIVHKGLI